MSHLVLKIITPEGVAFNEVVQSVNLPTVDGEVGILPGHIPLLTLLQAGEIYLRRNNGQVEHLAVDRGFARVFSNEVSILTEAAIHINDIDLIKVEEAQKRAEHALSEAASHPKFDPAEIEKLEAIMRFAVVQRLLKKRG